MMLRSRMLLISKELPSKYIECEYIENTSTAYINTLFKPNQDTKVEIEIDMGKYVKPYTDTCVFGEDNGWQKQGFGILIRHNNNQTFHLYNNQYRSPINFPTNISYKGKHILGKNKNDYYIDNVKIHTIEYNTFASPVPIHLLALGRPNNSIEAPAHCGTLAKIYNCRIWDNGILVRDYIPCYNKVSGLYGLYDKLNKEFYTSPNNVKFSGA